MEAFNDWLTRWESIWLFLLIAAELVVGFYSAVILTIEFTYDKAWNERMIQRRKRKTSFENLTVGEGK